VIPVVIESPYAGKDDDDALYAAVLTARNLHYLRACMKHCFALGEVPYASHAIYTQPGVLDDRVPEERRKGMNGGFVWGAFAHKRVVYVDLGLSPGMHIGVDEACRIGQPVVYRRLPTGWLAAMTDPYGFFYADVVAAVAYTKCARGGTLDIADTSYELWIRAVEDTRACVARNAGLPTEET
jgi:hypothetical protein